MESRHSSAEVSSETVRGAQREIRSRSCNSWNGCNDDEGAGEIHKTPFCGDSVPRRLSSLRLPVLTKRQKNTYSMFDMQVDIHFRVAIVRAVIVSLLCRVLCSVKMKHPFLSFRLPVDSFNIADIIQPTSRMFDRNLLRKQEPRGDRWSLWVKNM